MATKSGFGKGWKAFVDHKGSKLFLGIPWLSRRHKHSYQEFPLISCSFQKVRDNIAS